MAASLRPVSTRDDERLLRGTIFGMSGSRCYLCLTEITDNRKKVKLNGRAESGLEIREFLTCVLDEFYEADYETTTLYEREAFLCTKCVSSTRDLKVKLSSTEERMEILLKQLKRFVPTSDTEVVTPTSRPLFRKRHHSTSSVDIPSQFSAMENEHEAQLHIQTTPTRPQRRQPAKIEVSQL